MTILFIFDINLTNETPFLSVDRFSPSCYTTNTMNFLLIFSAKYLIIVPLLTVGLYFLLQKSPIKKQMFWIVLGCFPLAFILSRLAAHFYFDPRPFVTYHFTPILAHAPDNGFPSDHALFGSAIAAYAYLFHKKMGIVLMVLALFISAARVIIGIHSWIDIVGSFAISICSVWFVSFLCKKYCMKAKRV